MRAKEFIVERKKKRRVRRAAYGPGPYGLYGVNTGYSGDGGVGGVGEDRHVNDVPYGPETPPTMPAGTVRVDVSDVYDWYKLGQHIANLKGLGKHDFGKGPPSTIISFGSEEEEHEYLKDLMKIGLKTTDIDPKDPKQPKGMKKQKVDPTYNVSEDVHEEPTAHRIRVTVTDPNAEANVRTKEVQKTVRVTADDPRNAIKMARDYFVKKGYRVHDHHYISPVGVEENFADGKNPERKGLSKRVGIPKKSTLGQLEKIASSSTGERRRMAQWQLNMRRGKKK